jgi:hypothetical protein
MKLEKENTIRGESRLSEGSNVDRDAETKVQRKSSRVPEEQSSTSEPGDLTPSNRQVSSTNYVDKPVAEDVSHAVRRATGPRTARGKMRSRRNATKCGIFSRIIVVKGESRIEYESLLRGLREYCEPIGALEDLLVEELATNRWRYRRVLLAERGETGVNAISAESEKPSSRAIMNLLSNAESAGGGLIEAATDSMSLTVCIFTLKALRARIRDDGFKKEQDQRVLQKLYGHLGEFDDNLSRTYARWMRISELPEDERQRKGHPSLSACLENVSQAIDDETKRLEQLREKRARAQHERCRLEKLRLSIPGGPGSERLLRYETSLERSFDRTLHQLERLQRMRRGQPVAPPLDVKISA